MYFSLMPQAVNLGTVPFPTLVSLMRKYDIHVLDMDPAPLVKMYGMDTVQDILGRNGVQILSFMSPVIFHYEDERRYQSTFKNLIESAAAAQRLGIHRCTTWILNYSDDLPYDENFEMHRERLREICGILRENDIRLGLEFVGPRSLLAGHKYPFIDSLPKVRELCKAVGADNIGLLLDCYHCYTAGRMQEDLASITNQEEIVCVHISDAQKDLPLEECLDNVRYLPGDGGAINVREFLNKLNALKYNGPVILEPFSARINGMTDPELILHTIRQSVMEIWPGER